MGYNRGGGYRHRANPQGPATENRRDFLSDLLRKRIVPTEMATEVKRVLNLGPQLTNNLASYWIDELLGCEIIPNPDAVNREGNYQLPPNHPTYPNAVAIVHQRKDKRGFWAGIRDGDHYVKGLIDDIQAAWFMPSATDIAFGYANAPARPAPAQPAPAQSSEPDDDEEARLLARLAEIHAAKKR
jgi:hypothetical protein